MEYGYPSALELIRFAETPENHATADRSVTASQECSAARVTVIPPFLMTGKGHLEENTKILPLRGSLKTMSRSVTQECLEM